jgi:hypothetical protein
MFGRSRLCRGKLPARHKWPNRMMDCTMSAPVVVLLGSSFVTETWSKAMRWVYGLDRQGWFLLLCGVLVVGVICLRGFGSRSNY